MKFCFSFVLLLGLVSCSDSDVDPHAGIAAKSGDTVFIHYTGKVVDGDVFETTLDGEARGIVIGQHETLPYFEQALIGMKPGESKSITLTPEEGFGPYRDEPGMTHTMERKSLAHTIEPLVGQQLNAAIFLPDQPADQSQIVPVVITAVTDTTITVDANHPLAGKSLNFEVMLMDIKR